MPHTIVKTKPSNIVLVDMFNPDKIYYYIQDHRNGPFVFKLMKIGPISKFKWGFYCISNSGEFDTKTVYESTTPEGAIINAIESGKQVFVTDNLKTLAEALEY